MDRERDRSLACGRGTSGASFAALYRKHTHRKYLVEALNRRQIPFVIKRLSILGSTLIRDVMAYSAIDRHASDDVSCARIIASALLEIEPRDLVRLAERAAKSKGKSLWDEFEAWCKDPARAAEGIASARACGIYRRNARACEKIDGAYELLLELIAKLGVAPLPADMDSYNLARLKEFVEEWQKKGDGRSLHDFLNYLNFFEEAERRHFSAERAGTRRGAIDDRSFGKGPRIPARLYPASLQGRFSIGRAPASVRISAASC